MKQISKQSLFLIVLSFLVSAVLIVTVIVYAAKTDASGMGFVIGMVLLAALVFALFTLFRLRRSRYARMLAPDYYTAYEQISDALNTEVLSKAEQREVKADVLAMLIDAQRQGRDVRDVTGGDIQAFLARVKGAFGYRSSIAFSLCESVQFGVLLAAFLQTANYFRMGDGQSFFESGLSLIMLILYVPLVFVVYPLLRRAMRRQKTGSMLLVMGVYAIVFIGMIIVLDNFAGDTAWVRYILATDVAVIFSWWMAAVLAGAAIIAQGVKMAMRRRSLRRL